MYAQLETLVPAPGTGSDDAVRRLDAAAGRPGFRGGYVFGQLGHDRLTVLTFWSASTGGFGFDGPIADPVLKAAKYAGQLRLTPAIQATPGTVRGWALIDPARRAMCVINLVTSVDALDALAHARESGDWEAVQEDCFELLGWLGEGTRGAGPA